MTNNKSYSQKYAMHFGTYMGIFWTLKFILFPLGFEIPFLMLLYICLTCAVPFMGYFYVRSYRDRTCDGTISFSHALIFSILMYMFASLLASVTHYIYFAFIDGGYIINEYSSAIEQLMSNTPGMENEKDALQTMIGELKSLTPIDITLQCLSSDIILCSIISVPTALFARRVKKNTDITDNAQ